MRTSRVDEDDEQGHHVCVPGEGAVVPKLRRLTILVVALFVLAGAEFIAGVQLLVYVGGVMVLFLVVIMLVHVGAEEKGREEIFNKQKQDTASLIFCFLLGGGVLYGVSEGVRGMQSGTSSSLSE